MELDDARRLIAAMNALTFKLEGDESDPGLIATLEQGSQNIHEAAESFNASTQNIARQILKQGLADKILQLLEKDLQSAIEKMGDEASMSSISYLVDRSVLQIRTEAEAMAAAAVERMWKTSASKHLEGIKEHLSGVQSNIEKASRRRNRTVLKLIQVQKQKELLELQYAAVRREKRLGFLLLGMTSIGLAGALIVLILLR